MKLSALKLDASVITNLYKKNLVGAISPNEMPGQATSIQPTGQRPLPADPLNFLGENRKNILITVDYAQAPFMPDEDLGFLTNMLSACKLSMADVAVLNLRRMTDPSFRQIAAGLSCHIVLLFGTAPSALQLPLDFPHFQVQSFNNTVFLYVPDLETIRNDKLLKSKLWVCLRKIFNV